MIIAIFTNNYLPHTSGVTTSIISFKKCAEKKGHKVIVFAPKYRKYKDTDRDIYRVPSIESLVYKNFRLPLPVSRKIEKIFVKTNPDIVFLQHPFLLGDIGLRFARKYNKPAVFRFHTRYDLYAHYVKVNQNLIRKIVMEIVKEFSNNCDLIIAPSKYIKEHIEKLGIKTRCEIIPTGIWVVCDKIKGDKIKDTSIREKYSLAKDTQILLHAGRLTKEKNLIFLATAIMKILKKEKNAVCFIAGDGVLKGEMQKFFEKTNLSHKIIFTGNLSRKELEEYYKSADLFLFASKTETQGLVILEAMACGTPSVAVDTPAIKDVLINGRNGILVKENAERFAETAISLLRNKRKLGRFSKEAVRTAQKFDEEVMVDIILKEMKKLSADPSKKYTRFSKLNVLKNPELLELVIKESQTVVHNIRSKKFFTRIFP